VVGRTEGTLEDQWVLGGQHPVHAVDLGHFQRFLLGHAGQDGRQAPGQQGLAAAGRAVEDQVVEPGGGHFQGPFGVLLAPDVGQVHLVNAGRVIDGLPAALGQGSDLPFAA